MWPRTRIDLKSVLLSFRRDVNYDSVEALDLIKLFHKLCAAKRICNSSTEISNFCKPWTEGFYFYDNGMQPSQNSKKILMPEAQFCSSIWWKFSLQRTFYH